MRLLSFIVLLLFSATSSAVTYYVKTGGNNTSAGTSDATAWATIAKVNSFSFAAGDDVYFRAGDTWSGTQLTVDWAGVSTANRAIIGSYYMNGGSETIGVPSGTNKPTITGSYAKPGDLINQAGSVPSSIYAGLIHITTSYVMVKDFRVLNSAGNGVRLHSTTSTPLSYTVFDNLTVDYTALSATSFNRSGTFNTLKNSEISWCSVARMNGDSPVPRHSLCAGAAGGSNSIYENNYFHNNFGENIIEFENQSRGIIRNNLFINNRTAAAYYDNANTAIIEDNIIVTTVDSVSRLGKGFSILRAEIAVAVEQYPNMYDSYDIIIRNNIIYSHNGAPCLTADMDPNARAANKQISYKAFNNTCIGGGSIRISPPVAYTGVIEVANNIFYNPFANTNTCTVTNTDLDAHHNYWNVTPPTTCQGTGDVVGDPLLNRSIWTGVTEASLPLISDFGLQAGSPALDVGLTQAVTEFTTELSQSADLAAGCTLDLTENANDFFDIDSGVGCNARANPPDMGALESGTVTAPTAVTVPYYLNTGNTGQLVLSKTYIAKENCIETGIWYGTEPTAIAGTTDDSVYQSYIASFSASGISCDFTIANGDYDIVLLFNEHYYGDNVGTCTFSGSDRKANIVVEGVTNSSNFDICTVSGAANTAVRKTIGNVTVSDGVLNIAVTPGVGVDTQPVLSGIEITTATPTGNTLTLTNTAPSVSLNNNYPNLNVINPEAVCGASTTSGDTVYNTGLVDNTTSGTPALSADGTLLEYTPANATSSGGVGSVQVTVNDGVDTEICTISITLQIGKHVLFSVFDEKGGTMVSTDGWSLCWTAAINELTIAGQVCYQNLSLDANSRLEIFDDRLPSYSNAGFPAGWIYYRLKNNNAVTGAVDGVKSYRTPSGYVKVPR